MPGSEENDFGEKEGKRREQELGSRDLVPLQIKEQISLKQ